MNNMDAMSVNALRILSADAVENAKSGHPGLPLGAAPMAYELWAEYMKHSPSDPEWPDRDRFVLSAGHGSALLYSLLHLFEYGLTIEDLKQFRQWNSKTPGHPEYKHTTGVEATTGPLGAGMATAVGMAIAEAHMAALFNKDDFPVVDHFTYVLGGDGCMMEGISYEAFSLAGTLGLGRLIVFYDSNNISIEGSTELAFTEDVSQRFAGFGFQVLKVSDGNNLEQIGLAIKKAKEDRSRPSVIIVSTKIGFGCPDKEGKASAHGEPLGAKNVEALRKSLNWPSQEAFYVPDEVYDHFHQIKEEKKKAVADWDRMFAAYSEKYPDMREAWNRMHDEEQGRMLLEQDQYWTFEEKEDSTRNISGIAINRIKQYMPSLIGGSADLAPSNKTNMKDAGDFSKNNYQGSNLHFGVREMAMAAIGNGIMLHGGLRAFVSTFFVFSDYLKPMARLSALMKLPLTYVLTHDSIGVGEDGPTHEPVEQLAMLRALPGLTVLRPADVKETLAAWYHAVTVRDSPTALVLTRQNVPILAGGRMDALKGGYIIWGGEKEVPNAIIMASGSEVTIAIKAGELLKIEGLDIRVVSMPSMELFDRQSSEYRESVLPHCVRARVAVEALCSFGWGKYTGLDGACVALDHFGASAPGEILFEKFGFTPEHIAETVKSVIQGLK